MEPLRDRSGEAHVEDTPPVVPGGFNGAAA